MPLRDVYLGLVCPVCTREKMTKTAFCSRCFHKLPDAMQKKLYRPFGKGFESAFDAAFWNLKNRPRPKREPSLFDGVEKT